MTANAPERFGSFFDRLQTERAALKVVNQKFADKQKLNGLTSAAIAAWVNSVAQNNPSHLKKVVAVAEILIRLSNRIDASADQSRTVFSDERFPLLPSQELLLELQEECLR